MLNAVLIVWRSVAVNGGFMLVAPARRDASIGIRTKPWIRDALQEAASREERSISWLVERIAAEWLKARGYSDPEEGEIPVRDRKRPRKPSG
jgi:hypothetical protein